VLDRAVVGREDGGVLKVPLLVLPDPVDAFALQSWIDVVADGVRLRMLVDTGSARSEVPRIESLAKRLVEGTSAGRGASGSSSNDPLVRLHTLQLGDLTVTDLTVGLQQQDWPHPPLLSMDVLGSHACHFRFDDQELHLGGPPPQAQGWIPLATEPHRAPAVDVHWESTMVSALWDTGAGITIVDRGWAESHPDVVTILTDTRDGTDATGAPVAGVEGWLAGYTVGDVSFRDQPCCVMDLSGLNAHLTSPIHMALGLPQISQASWYMDFPRGRWAITSTRTP
jgi:hypothetical protein